MKTINKIVYATITKGNQSSFKVITANDGKQIHSFDCTNDESMMFLLLTLSNQNPNAEVQKTTVINGVTTKVVIKASTFESSKSDIHSSEEDSSKSDIHSDDAQDNEQDNRTAEQMFEDAFNNINEETFIDEDEVIQDEEVKFESHNHYAVSEEDNNLIVEAFKTNKMFSPKFIHNQSDDAMVIHHLITTGQHSFVNYTINETIMLSDIQLLKQGQLSLDLIELLMIDINLSKSDRRSILKDIKKESIRANNQAHAQAHNQNTQQAA